MLLIEKGELTSGSTWHASGGIRIARTKEDLDWFNYLQGIADNIGFRMQIIGPGETRNINPHMSLAGVLAEPVYDPGNDKLRAK